MFLTKKKTVLGEERLFVNKTFMSLRRDLRFIVFRNTLFWNLSNNLILLWLAQHQTISPNNTKV